MLFPSWAGTEASSQLEAGLGPSEAEQFGSTGADSCPQAWEEAGLGGSELFWIGRGPPGTLDNKHPNPTFSVREQRVSVNKGRLLVATVQRLHQGGPRRQPPASRVHIGLWRPQQTGSR